MMDHICEVCQEYIATHIVTVYSPTKSCDHYLCDDHYDQMENPRRFLSLLDYPLEIEDPFLKEIYPD